MRIGGCGLLCMSALLRRRTKAATETSVVGRFAFGGRAILPAAGFQQGRAALKGGCGQDWPPSKTKRIHYPPCRSPTFSTQTP